MLIMIIVIQNTNKRTYKNYYNSKTENKLDCQYF